LYCSLLVNLGLLGVFKYFNFFSESFAEAFSLFGAEIQRSGLNIVLPVGISFYTFQTLSYTIDVYRKKFEPVRDGIAFFAFVSFFPQLVAGPIERASHFLPQFSRNRTFEYDRAVDGLRQMLWGFFKKVVIADNCAAWVNSIFDTPDQCHGTVLILGVFLFAFQIYGDFSGYSDIAIGLCRLFGFSLMRNFAYPYFSRDIAEFWRRWHISLSSWFRDYLYIPLGGNRGSKWKSVRNVFVVFLVSGLWHGANWTFVVWGFLHAMYFLPLWLMGNHRTHVGPVGHGRRLPSLREVWQISCTATLVGLAWVFFRSASLMDAAHYLYCIPAHLFEPFFGFVLPDLKARYLLPVLALIVVEWVQRNEQHGLDFQNRTLPRAVRWCIYYTLLGLLLFMGGSSQEFIYFQF
jgi:alginate O-acetyltransferase complex protein AlgI